MKLYGFTRGIDCCTVILLLFIYLFIYFFFAGARPGVTVRVQNRVKILNKPPIYVLDTPGLLSPRLNDIEETMKLALCNLIKEGAAPTHYIADYLLYWLNKFVLFFQYPLTTRLASNQIQLLINRVKANFLSYIGKNGTNRT